MPTIVRRRGTRAAIEAVYQDVAPEIEAAARRHAAQYNDDPDGSLSDAHLVFLEAYHTHDDSRSEFGQRLTYLLPLRLMERARRYAKRDSILHRVGVDLETAADAAPDAPSPYSLEALTARVSPDARLVLALLFDGEPDLEEAIRSDQHPGPASVRRHLTTYIHERWGWELARVRAVFSEIGDAI